MRTKITAALAAAIFLAALITAMTYGCSASHTVIGGEGDVHYDVRGTVISDVFEHDSPGYLVDVTEGIHEGEAVTFLYLWYDEPLEGVEPGDTVEIWFLVNGIERDYPCYWISEIRLVP